MATLTFKGTKVGAVGSANDDGAGGVDLILDQTQDLDGNSNPYYHSTDTISISVDDDDMGPNGKLVPGGEGEVTVTSILVNGVEIPTAADKITYCCGSDTPDGGPLFHHRRGQAFLPQPDLPERCQRQHAERYQSRFQLRTAPSSAVAVR